MMGGCRRGRDLHVTESLSRQAGGRGYRTGRRCCGDCGASSPVRCGRSDQLPDSSLGRVRKAARGARPLLSAQSLHQSDDNSDLVRSLDTLPLKLRHRLGQDTGTRQGAAPAWDGFTMLRAAAKFTEAAAAAMKGRMRRCETGPISARRPATGGTLEAPWKP
jgi:hypothetical protein